MKKYTTSDLELANELLADQNHIDKFGNKLWSWSNIQWALLVQMWFDKMKLAALRLKKRFRYSFEVCIRWAIRSSNEGTLSEVLKSTYA
jgi:hypothetical protein